MKKNIVITCIILLIFTLSITISASESSIVDSMEFQGTGADLTFDKALNAAMESNAAISAARSSLEQAKTSYNKKKSSIEDTRKQLENLRETKDSLNYMQGVTLPMLNLDYSVESTQRTLDAIIVGQKAAVEQTYFSLLQASRQCEIQKENLDISASLYEKLQKKYSLGLIAKQEVLNGEMNLLDSQISYKSALNNLSKAKMALNNVLGYDLMNEINLQDELTYKEFKVDSIAKAINDAISNRNEIKSLEYAHKLEVLNLDITRRIYSEGTYTEQEQIIKKDKALDDLENTKKAIELEVRNNYLDVLQKQEEIKSGEKSVELANEAFRLSQATYDAGLGLQTDVQKAQVSLQQAKLGLAQAILDYNLAVSKFNDCIGIGRK